MVLWSVMKIMKQKLKTKQLLRTALRCSVYSSDIRSVPLTTRAHCNTAIELTCTCIALNKTQLHNAIYIYNTESSHEWYWMDVPGCFWRSCSTCFPAPALGWPSARRATPRSQALPELVCRVGDVERLRPHRCTKASRRTSVTIGLLRFLHGPEKLPNQRSPALSWHHHAEQCTEYPGRSFWVCKKSFGFVARSTKWSKTLQILSLHGPLGPCPEGFRTRLKWHPTWHR